MYGEKVNVWHLSIVTPIPTGMCALSSAKMLPDAMRRREACTAGATLASAGGRGTREYTAPEVLMKRPPPGDAPVCLLKQGLRTAADVWSFGVMACELCSLSEPYRQLTVAEISWCHFRGITPPVRSPPAGANWSTFVIAIERIKKCFETTPVTHEAVPPGHLRQG